jgi:hypothetical protein
LTATYGEPMTGSGRPLRMNRTVGLALGAGAVLAVLIVIGQVLLMGQILFNTGSNARLATGTAGATSIQCSPYESLATHYHVALLIHRNGGTDVLPSQTGINVLCLYWIHVHDDSGIVHVEAPAAYRDHAFLLADAFAVAKLRLDAHHLGSASFPDGSVSVYVDGVKWKGAPGEVPLVNLQTIDVVAPGESFSYQPYAWPSGFQPPPSA